MTRAFLPELGVYGLGPTSGSAEVYAAVRRKAFAPKPRLRTPAWGGPRDPGGSIDLPPRVVSKDHYVAFFSDDIHIGS